MKRWIHAATDQSVVRAMNKTKSDVRKAIKQWYRERDVEIDNILRSFGYLPGRYSVYTFYKDYKDTKGNNYYVFIDTYHLVQDGGYVEVFVSSDPAGKNKLIESKQSADISSTTKVNASKLSDQIARIQKAKRDLIKYDKEKVDYVRECQDEITKVISDYYAGDDDVDYTGPKLSEIKRDYLVGAIEDDLMTEEEFEDIFDLLDIIDIEYAESAV